VAGVRHSLQENVMNLRSNEGTNRRLVQLVFAQQMITQKTIPLVQVCVRKEVGSSLLKQHTTAVSDASNA
jgi:hypothetical protein